jgi:hypothetical protein
MNSRHLYLSAALMACLVTSPTSAQVAVTDPATTLQNTVTAAIKSRIVDTMTDQHSRLRRMAQRLSMFTDLHKYAISDPAPWRVHDLEGFLFIDGLNGALSFGDAQGSSYLALGRTTGPRIALPATLPIAARRLLASQFATIELSDAVATAAIHQTGQLRLTGRRQEQPAIAALERHVIDGSLEQSATAVLDKIAGATLIGARQRQARTQLLSATLEQLLVENKRTRDAEAATLAMQLARLDASTWADETRLLSGAAEPLRSWRQP